MKKVLGGDANTARWL